VRHENPERAAVLPDDPVLRPGALDDMSWGEPVGNIWTASKAARVTIDATLVNFPGQPPAREPRYDAWAKTVAAAEPVAATHA
jgi:hypothetical protein